MRWDVARTLSEQHGLPRSSIFETLYRTDTWRDIERGIGDAEAWKARAHAELETRAAERVTAGTEKIQPPVSYFHMSCGPTGVSCSITNG